MKKTCSNGHTFEKSSDCPTCPICEQGKKPGADFPKLGRPALRALENAGIRRLKDLAKWTEKDLLSLHGLGPSAIPPLKAAMKTAAVSFKSAAVKSNDTGVQAVSRYLATVPQPMRRVLAALRAAIRAAAPRAEETISYGIPTYKLNGPLIHWAAFKNHASLIGVEKQLLQQFAGELAPFKTAGSTIRFTAENPLPAALVKKLVKYRVAQNLQLKKARQTMKSARKTRMEKKNEQRKA